MAAWQINASVMLAHVCAACECATVTMQCPYAAFLGLALRKDDIQVLCEHQYDGVVSRGPLLAFGCHKDNNVVLRECHCDNALPKGGSPCLAQRAE